MRKQHRWIIVFFSFLLITSLACDALSGDEDSGNAEEPLSSSSVSEEAVAAEEPTDETGSTDSVDEREEADDTPSDADQDVEEPTEGTDSDTEAEAGDVQTLTLDQNNNFGAPADASSYRVRFAMDITVADGDEETQVMNIVGEGAVTTDPPASSFDIQVLGIEGASAFSDISMVQIEDSTYIVSPIGGCVSGDFVQDLIDFDDFTSGGDYVGGVNDARLVDKNVEINGVNTDHYSFDQGDLDGSGAIGSSIDNFQGDLFVSDEGNLVRIEFSGEGSSGIPGLPSAGEGQVHYQLDYFDVGEPIEIVVPEGCDAAGSSDLPVISDATDLFTAAGVTTYMTNLGFDEIIEFYKTEMEAGGWSLDLESTFGNTATLTFVSDGTTVTLIVSEDPSSGSFAVLLTEQ